MSPRASFLLLACVAVAQLMLLTEAATDSKGKKSSENDKGDSTEKAKGQPVKADKQHVTRKTLKADIQRLEAQIEQLSKAAGAGASGLTYMDGNRILVFRLTAGAGGSTYDRYTSAGVNDDLYSTLIGCGCKTVNGSCNTHYRSGVLDQWPSALIDTVRVSVYKQGKEVAYVEFDGRGSDNKNWFSVNRVVSSSWTDVKTETHNFFSIEGGGFGRRFFISRNYGGCAADRSWLVVSDQVDPCAWGKVGTVPVILYSKLPTYGNPNDAAQFDKADVLTVTMKLNSSC